MPIALAHVEKEYQGEVWENTYCVGIGATSQFDTFPDGDEMVTIGAAGAFTDAETDPANPAYLGGTHILNAIIGFERKMVASFVAFKSIYVTDGKQRPTGNTEPNVFMRKALSGNGLWAPNNLTQGNYVPGNTALLISRVPSGFNSHSGRIQLRACLHDGEVRFGGKGGIDWTDAEQKGYVQTRFDQALDQSQLDFYLDDGFGEGTGLQTLCIPHYVSVKHPIQGRVPGDLYNATVIANLVMQKPMSRQMAKGRKKKVVAQPPNP